MVFSGYSGQEYGVGATNSALRYAFGDSPLGPWRSGGVLVDSRGIVLNEDGSKLMTTNAAHNTHGSLEEINGQWYVFYHRPPRGFGNARQAMVAPVKITWDKKPVAKGGMVKITGYDPYVKDNEWKAIASNGDAYTGAEVTSEGFQIFGLPPYQYYSAGIACFMTGNQWLQDTHDNWDNHMDLAGITNKGIIGFKYFGFGGLPKDSKGVKAFVGTKKGDGTILNLNLTPQGKGAFKIHVMLDGPYANSTWKGREIAVLSVPEDAPQVATMFQVAVPDVEGLLGKHAIYLVAEGPEVQQPENNRPRFGGAQRQPQRPVGLFDFHGIGFSCNSVSIARPVVPMPKITVDGKALRIPSTPVFATGANGYTEANHYQVYAPMTDQSVIKASASDPSVKIEVSGIVAGRASVKMTYQGQEKIFLIN